MSDQNATQEPFRIFICYRRRDTTPIAGRLYDQLRTHFGPAGVFRDIYTMRPGDDIDQVLVDELDRCPAVLVLIGTRWRAHGRLRRPGDYVRKEVEHALRTGAAVIPLLVEDARMPARRQLPGTLRGLANQNAVALCDRTWDEDTRQLVDELERLRDRPPPLHPREPPIVVDRTRPVMRVRWAYVVGACCLALTVLVGLVPDRGVVTTPNDLGSSAPGAEPVTEGVLPGGADAVATALLNNRPVVVTGGPGGAMRVWDLASRQPLLPDLDGNGGAVTAVATAVLDGGGPVAVAGSADGSLQVWDLDRHERVGGAWIGHRGAVRAIATAQRGGTTVIISGGDDGTVRVWDLATTHELVGSPILGHRGPVRAVATALLNGDTAVLSGGDDRIIDVHDLATHELKGVLTGAGAIGGIATAQIDSHAVVVAGGERSASLWDLATYRPFGSPASARPGGGKVVTTAQVGGHTVVVTGGGDHSVHVWNPADGTDLDPPLTGQIGEVTALATAQLGGHTMIISCDDANSRVWDLTARTT